MLVFSIDCRLDGFCYLFSRGFLQMVFDCVIHFGNFEFDSKLFPVSFEFFILVRGNLAMMCPTWLVRGWFIYLLGDVVRWVTSDSVLG